MTDEEKYTEYKGDEATQNANGAFFTPKVLVEKMYENVTDYVGKTFFDPCAGYGALLIFALDKKVELGEDPSDALLEVYGCELDEPTYNNLLKKLEIWGFEHNCSKYALEAFKDHFVCGDFLKFKGFNDNGKSLGFKTDDELKKEQDKAKKDGSASGYGFFGGRK